MIKWLTLTQPMLNNEKKSICLGIYILLIKLNKYSYTIIITYLFLQ